jgi:sulfite exporter TauE/SafE
MLVTAFILGLMGSFHCVGMCGPIAFLLPLDRSNSLLKYVQLLLYHTGRLITYAILGILFGLLGKSLYLFGFQQQLSIGIGLVMILLVLMPESFLRRYAISKPVYQLISKVKSALGSQLKQRTPDTFFTIGFLNGFLPCGLVYMALLGAVGEANVWEGSMYMVLFGMGTIPLMTATLFLGNFLKGEVRTRIRRLIPVFVVLVGVLFILRGLGLGIPYISPKPVPEIIDAGYECPVSFLFVKNNNLIIVV